MQSQPWILPSHLDSMVDVFNRVAAAWAVGEEIRLALRNEETLKALNEYAAFWGITINALFSAVFIGMYQLHDTSRNTVSIPKVLDGGFGSPPASIQNAVNRLLAPRKAMLSKMTKVRHKILAHLAPGETWEHLFNRLGIPREQVSLNIKATGEVLSLLRVSNENIHEDLSVDQPVSAVKDLIRDIVVLRS